MLLNVNSVEFERIRRDLEDSYDEEYGLELEDRVESAGSDEESGQGDILDVRFQRRAYFRELFRLQHELVKLQDWVMATGHRLVIVFEGRDAAGNGGIIKRIRQRLLPERERHDDYAWRPVPEEISVPQVY